MPMTVLGARLAFLATAVSGLMLAQQSELVHVTVVKVQPGMVSEWQDMQAKMMEAYKKEGTPWRQVWGTATFGERAFVTVFPVGKMERYDSPSPIRKSMTDAAYARYLQKMSRIVASTHSYLVRTRPDLGISSGQAKPRRAMVTTIVVEPGKNNEFEAFLRNDVKPAWQKAGMKEVWVDQTMIGGYSTEYTILYHFDKWAELEGGSPMEKALGRVAWDNIRSKIAGLASSVKTEVMALEPELSYMQQ